MNALVNIQLEAQVIVEQLADRQISEMKERYNEYQEWVQIASNPVMRAVIIMKLTQSMRVRVC
jgi:hypothetical protein